MTLSFGKSDLIIGAIILILLAFLIYNHRKSKTNPSLPEQGLNIKELINKVESELQKAEQEKIESKQSGLFLVKTFDLEISFLIKTRFTQTGTVEYDFIVVSAEDEVSTEQTQKITLHLETVGLKTASVQAQEQVDTSGQPVIQTSPPPSPKATPSQKPERK